MTYAVIVMRTRRPAEYEAVYSPFASEDKATEWLTQNGIGTESPLEPNERRG